MREPWRTSLRAAIGSAALAVAAPVLGQDHGSCPGVIISEIPAPAQIFGVPINPIYVSDPCILVLSNGDYLASHAQFGSASGSSTSGKTRVFRSADKGATWTKVNGGADLTGILRGSLFEHGGTIYLLGANNDASGNAAVMMRSENGGDSWTSTSFSPLGGMATPDNAQLLNGRIWLASTRSSLSAADTSDPFQVASWTRGDGFPTPSDSWLPGTGFTAADNFIGEGQMTASPTRGLAILAKVRLLPYAATISVHPSSGIAFFDPDRDFVPLPGGEKKFGARFDPVSGKYFLLSNPILPAHDGSGLAPDLIRNTAAVLTSRDLAAWSVEKIFLYSANISYEGFQYFNFDFDGEDIVVGSRTAFDVGGNRPPRAHDSNLLTFHRISGFRTLAREHVLRIEGAQVRRYEKTQHADAPLGAFPLGDSFAGAPLANPVSFAVDQGDIYIQEAGGRVLRFDWAGNFLGTAPSAPGGMQSGELALPQPPQNEFSWVAPGSGAWDEPRNWHYWNRPGHPSGVPIFGSAATSAAVAVALPSNARSWYFNAGGDFEGWTTNKVDNATVSGGTLRGVAQSSGDPIVQRLNLNLAGDEVSEIRVRMRVDASGNVPVDLYWGNWATNTFAEARKVRVNYTGNNGLQDVVFTMAGRTGWTGERITRLRLDPVNGSAYAGAAFEIDSIEVPRATDHTRLDGMRFIGTAQYTLAGPGSLQIRPDTGTGLVEVLQGSHAIAAPLDLGADTAFHVATGSALEFSATVTGAGALTKSGAGTLRISAPLTHRGATIAEAGTLILEQATLSDTSAVRIARGATLRLEHNAADTVGELWLAGEKKWKGTWGPVGSAARYQTPSLTGTGFLQVADGPDPGFAGWAWETGLTGAPGLEAGWRDDPDRDGLPNALEWLLGGNPLRPDSASHRPETQWTASDLALTFRRSDDSESALSLTVQYSVNLLANGWLDAPIGPGSSGPDAAGIVVNVAENGDAPDAIRVTLPLALAPDGHLFARLKATSGDP